MATIRSTSAQQYWLAELSLMTVPLRCPSPEAVTYAALTRRGLAAYGWTADRLESGWVITGAGRAWIGDRSAREIKADNCRVRHYAAIWGSNDTT